jgi:deazaflavin-dependent oxidoreductase (nitroreductase family)
MLTDLAHGDLAKAEHLSLTTTGRLSGRTQTIELWFAAYHDTVYMLSSRGADADWVRNIDRDPEVELRIGRVSRLGHARRITEPDEDVRARRLVVCKYQPHASAAWGAKALALAVDLR